MKKIVILLVLLVAIVGTAYFQSNKRNSRLNRSAMNVKLRELLFPEFDINGIKKIRIKEDKSEATLAVQNDTWVVLERAGYPVEKEKLQTALLSLKYEKIKGGRHIGKDSWGKVGVNSPGNATASGAGTLVELFDEKDALKYSFVLGGQVNSSGGSNNDQMQMFGGPKGNRFIRIQGEDTIWEINDQLPDLVTKPDAWLAKGFFDVQRLKSVEITAAKPADSWKASRTDDKADFTLDGAGPGESIDAGKVSLGTLLSSSTFNDVLSKDKAVATMKDAVKAKLVTFDGFTYNIQVVKQAGQGEGDKYYLTMSISADLPKERAAVKDEKPEDKKKNDEAFAEEKKKLEEKLANEKRFEGWVYEVTEYTVSSLLKKRSEILAAPAPAKQQPPAAGGNASPSGLPDIKKMIPGLNMVQPPAGSSSSAAPAVPAANPTPPISATTPAVPLPSAPKTELKPAPSPDANPATGTKPAQPAPDKPAEPAKPAPDKPAEPAKPAANAPK
ncbi:MAG: DUF4340 domain-containing protein [Prosthecobacter sp.]|uniref:DUF4340 domain-containing protein n=1 Tax=Prosthecobacter sp. TaxID=1965333 RepID=UPI003BAEC253